MAGPKNAQRLRRKTPCAVRADKCYDCKSPERICRALTVFWEKPTGIPETELVVVFRRIWVIDFMFPMEGGTPLKKRMLPLLLCLALLAGCASMLDRDYVSVEPHDQFSDTRTDSSALQAENYQGLVNAIVYLVSQGSEEGVVRLYNYTRDVDTDLSSACLEVAKKDPLGAYAVDYIKYDFSRIISHYEANVQITYRRTAAQIKSVVSVTGSSAIKGELREALTKFSPEVVLVSATWPRMKISSWAPSGRLLRHARVAFGLPDAQVTLYPDSGTQRIVEILLTYPEDIDALRQKRNDLATAAEKIAAALSQNSGNLPGEVFTYLRAHVRYQAEEGAAQSTAYAALVGGKSDSEGMALAFQLLCDLTGVESSVVTGSRDGASHFWNLVKTADGWLHVDAARSDGLLLADDAMTNAGYAWNTGDYPASSGISGGPAQNGA